MDRDQVDIISIAAHSKWRRRSSTSVSDPVAPESTPTSSKEHILWLCIMFLLVRELFSPGNDNKLRRVFALGGEERDGGHTPNLQHYRWLGFIFGYTYGAVSMRNFTWLLKCLYVFSGDSDVTLFLCMASLTGADAYFLNCIVGSVIRKKNRSIPHLLLLLWHISY